MESNKDLIKNLTIIWLYWFILFIIMGVVFVIPAVSAYDEKYYYQDFCNDSSIYSSYDGVNITDSIFIEWVSGLPSGNPDYFNMDSMSEFEENEGAVDQIRKINATHSFSYQDIYYGAYLVYDFGLGNEIYDFNLTWEWCYVNSTPSGQQRYNFMAMTESVLGDFSDVQNGRDMASLLINKDTSDNMRWRIRYEDDDETFTPASWTTNNAIDDGWLFVWVNKSDTDWVMCVYDDPDMSNMLFSYNCTMDDDIGIRFVYPACAYGTGTYPNQIMGAYVKNLRLNNATVTGSGFSLDGGYVISVDIAEFEGDYEIIKTNVSIITNTGVSLELSVDGSNWVNSSGISGVDNLLTGVNYIPLNTTFFDNVDLLYYRLNLTTIDTASTPVLYRFELLYDFDEGKMLVEEFITGQGFWLMWFLSLALGILIGKAGSFAAFVAGIGLLLESYYLTTVLSVSSFNMWGVIVLALSGVFQLAGGWVGKR